MSLLANEMLDIKEGLWSVEIDVCCVGVKVIAYISELT